MGRSAVLQSERGADLVSLRASVSERSLRNLAKRFLDDESFYWTGGDRWRRLSDSCRAVDLFRWLQLVWTLTRRHPVRRRAGADLHSYCLDAAGVAGAEFDLLFASPVLLIQAKAPMLSQIKPLPLFYHPNIL